jgi:hypothetical protein
MRQIFKVQCSVLVLLQPIEDLFRFFNGAVAAQFELFFGEFHWYHTKKLGKFVHIDYLEA